MKFQQSGCLCAVKRTGWPGPSAKTVERVQEMFVRSPQKSTHCMSWELQMPQSSVWRILRKRLSRERILAAAVAGAESPGSQSSFTLLRGLPAAARGRRVCWEAVFSDKAAFHVCGKVNHHNVRIWGTENPHATMEPVHDLPKVNVFCAVSSCKPYGPFFFVEPTVTGINYLYMLQLWLMAQLQEDSEDFIFEQDGTPPHFHFHVRAHLNANLPGSWIGHASHDSPLLPWPPWSPDLTPCDFFLWGYIKDRVYVPPMPRDLPQLRQRIVEAVAAIGRQMLQHVWQELDYRLDICRVTKGGRIEHL